MRQKKILLFIRLWCVNKDWKGKKVDWKVFKPKDNFVSNMCVHLFHCNVYPYFAEKLEHGQLTNEKRQEMVTGLYNQNTNM